MSRRFSVAAGAAVLFLFCSAGSAQAQWEKYAYQYSRLGNGFIQGTSVTGNNVVLAKYYSELGAQYAFYADYFDNPSFSYSAFVYDYYAALYAYRAWRFSNDTNLYNGWVFKYYAYYYSYLSS